MKTEIKTHNSVRVYNNGSRVETTVREFELEDHIAYNRRNRFDCALFIDGECVNDGYLDRDRIREIEIELQSTKINLSN